MARRYWLVKSEPDVHSFEHHKSLPDSTDSWDGVRNYQARNYMRDDMKCGDRVIFYHSNTNPPHAAGIAEIARESYPDHTSWNPKSKYYDEKSSKEEPRWFMVDIRALEPLNRTVSLAELKANPLLSEMPLVQRGSRLSVMPMSEEHYEEILRMGETEDP
jgi:predicted RNA-binding protein with PUA-like domain